MTRESENTFDSILKDPSNEEETPLEEPTKEIFTKGKSSFVLASRTVPVITIDCPYEKEKGIKKRQ